MPTNVFFLACLLSSVHCLRQRQRQSSGNEEPWEFEDEETIMRLELDTNLDEGNATTTVTVTKPDSMLEGGQASGDVLCGGHRAASCRDCPQGHGAGWCNGDCTWQSGFPSGKCVPLGTPVGGSPSPGGNPFGCSRNWLGQMKCRARTASTHFNFKRPNTARDAAWYYNEITPTHSSSATYYASNTHGYGYAGIQMVSKDASKGHVAICSTWDQDTGNAVMEKCGAGVDCSGFRGEGEGAKAMWRWRWTMGKRYAWALHRAELPNGRVQHACWFYADELRGSQPGGWKHIATTSSGKKPYYGATFKDSGSFLEQWTYEDTQDLRQGTYGPVYYKTRTGQWQQSVSAKFSHYVLPERLQQGKVRNDYVSAGLAGRRLYMATGGNQKPNPSLARNPRDIAYPVATSIPEPLVQFEQHKASLSSAANLYTPGAPATPTPTPTAPTVSCGNHYAASCAACPWQGGRNMGSSWCNGQCKWRNGQCVQ